MLFFKYKTTSFKKNRLIKLFLYTIVFSFMLVYFNTASFIGSIYADEKELADISVPFIMPCSGSILKSFREEYFDEEKKVTRKHTGIDIYAKEGSEISAAGRGIVSYCGFSPIGGRTVVIKHNTKIRSTYLNFLAVYVSPGDYVEQGEVIGLAGASDDPSSELSHIHFAIIYDGFYLDPEAVLNIDYRSISKYLILKYCSDDFEVK